MPEITVIMGVYNGGDYLAEAIASLRSQTFSDWELVLVDDGSTDGAVDRVLAAAPEPRCRVIRHAEPLGVGGALMVACTAATGRYLAVLDHDDLARPRRFELQRAFLEMNPDIALLGSVSEVIDASGRSRGHEPFAALHEEIYAMTAYVHVLRHSGVMFRRELLEHVCYRALVGAAADFDFFARAAEQTRTACLPLVLCRYRWHGRNTSFLSAARTAAGGGLVRMLTRRRRSGLPEDFLSWHQRFSATPVPGNVKESTVHLRCARIFSAEGHDDLAALHAWLAWRSGGHWRAGLCYAAATARGLGRRHETRVGLIKAWLKEPAHQLLRAGGMPDRMQF